jgi:hypothetical protein
MNEKLRNCKARLHNLFSLNGKCVAMCASYPVLVPVKYVINLRQVLVNGNMQALGLTCHGTPKDHLDALSVNLQNQMSTKLKQNRGE